jgi:hypothetical protein
VRSAEIDRCLRLYRHAVAAFGDLEARLAAFVAAADGLPLLRRMQERLAAVRRDLERIGDGLAVLPELAEQLRAEKRISAQLREQAERAGLVLRYDTDSE